METSALHKRIDLATKRMRWFEKNLYDIRRKALAAELRNFNLALDLYSGRVAITEKSVSELEAMVEKIERKYKPEDAYLWEEWVNP